MSNVYNFELKRNIISCLIWVVISLLFIALYGSFYSYFAESQGELFSSIPEAFQAAVNISAQSFSSYGGYYSFTLTYVNVIASLYFAILAYNLYNREYSHKLNEYLLTKPISRTTLYLAKMSVGITLLIIFNLIYFSVSIIIAKFNAGEDFILNDILLLNILVIINTLFFFAVGSLVAVFNIKIKFSAFLAMPLVFGFFFISVFQQLINSNWLQYFSIFTLFSAQDVLSDGFEAYRVFIYVCVVLVSLVLSYLVYTRKEVK